MKIEICCMECGKKITIVIYASDGYIEVTEGNFNTNRMTDGSKAIDFFCDDCWSTP